MSSLNGGSRPNNDARDYFFPCHPQFSLFSFRAPAPEALLRNSAVPSPSPSVFIRVHLWLILLYLPHRR
jgi:hypothetical protein